MIDGRQPWHVVDPVLDAHDDHRIGMVLGIAALLVETPLQLKGADSVRISYPEFFDDLDQLL